jgi:GGDEF domain-containing protein
MAGMIVAAAVLQDSHRMAFYDELTGLPGRRALNERLGSLDRSFTLAMVDIDHFKAASRIPAQKHRKLQADAP